MATFTVDAINNAKQKQNEQADIEANVVQLGRQLQRMSVKGAEQNMKKVTQEKERLIKVQEQRLSRILLMKIERRFQAFPFLQEKIPPLSSKPSLPELQETDELQKLELNLQGSEKRLRSYISQGSLMLEAFWGDGSKITFLPEALRLNLKGLGNVINSEQFQLEADSLIKETVIEYPEFGQLSLGARWAQCVIQTMLTVHKMNTDCRFREFMQKTCMKESEISDEDEDEECDAQSTTTTNKN